MKKRLGLLSLILAVALLSASVPAEHAEARETSHPGTTVIMLDPGHGGSDLGAEYDPFYERDLTLIVARYMYAELSQYDNVVVYMTRNDDTDVSLKERVDMAAAVDADFLFSIHFNARAEHDAYGSEVLVSAYGEEYAADATFANLELQQLAALGLYTRGISTRLNKAGTADYYGIIHRATAYGIPGVITEHCYLDHPVDRLFLARADALQLLAHADVTALAEYLHLKSTALGTDYTDYVYTEVPVPTVPMVPDTTPPDISVVTAAVYNPATDQTLVHFEAADLQSPVLYYEYSLDNGATWSGKLPMNQTQQTQTIYVPAKKGGSVCVRVWNLYFYYTTSPAALVQ